MGINSAILILIAALAGGAMGLARSNTDAGRQFRQAITGVGSSTPEPAAAHDQTFYAPKFDTDRPQSISENFVIDGKPDPTFANCLKEAGAASPAGMEALGREHEHLITASLVNCLLTHDRQRFCSAPRRQQVASAMELYLWSRDYNFNNRVDLDRRFRLAHIKHPGDSPSDSDPYYKTWDGPHDKDVVDNLKSLARNGYIDPDAFGLLPRYEIRQAMDGMKSQYAACSPQKS